MRVFKSCFTIMRRHMISFIIYFSIFITLSVVISSLSVQSYSTDFEAERPSFAILNRDKDSAYAEGFLKFLSGYGKQTVLKDEKKVLQDAVFYHEAEYIVIIPKGFTEQWKDGENPKLEAVMAPDSAAGYYLDSLTSQYWNLAYTYRQALPSMGEDELIDAVIDDLDASAEVEKEQFLESQPVPMIFEIYNRMMAYILLILVMLCVSTVFLAFKRPDLQMRNLCSPMKPVQMGGQIALFNAVIAFGSWLLLNAVGLCFYGQQIKEVDPRVIGLFILSGFIFMLVALSISLLASRFVKNENAQNIASNFISLALCFLGGVFVPLELLGPRLLNVSKFTPTYWYIKAIEAVSDLTSFDSEALRPVFSNLLVLLGFAVAIFCVYLVVNQYKNRSEESFGSIQTEIEA